MRLPCQANFIHIDLDKDQDDKLGLYLNKLGFYFTTLNLPHSHKSKSATNILSMAETQRINKVLDVACMYQYDHPRISEQLFKLAHDIHDKNAYCRKNSRKLNVTSRGLVSALGHYLERVRWFELVQGDFCP